ncbi:MAG: hypothetical protein Kow0092_00870 [Deferrisomatales bacterium]
MKLLLEPDELVCFREDLRGATIRCLRGAVWVTQAGDSRDRVLSPGDAYEVARKGTVQVWARGASQLQLLVPEPVPSVRLAWRSRRPCPCP